MSATNSGMASVCARIASAQGASIMQSAATSATLLTEAPS